MKSIRHCTFLLAALFCFNILQAQPVISSFSPASGLIGSTVTINGTGFSVTPANNIVRFGTIKAVVTGATGSSLTVIVPRGARLLPISVTVYQLTGWSDKLFNVTSAASSEVLSFNSFDLEKTFPANTGDWTLGVGDLDGDGLADLVHGNYNAGSSISVYRNNSTGPGVISLEPKVEIYSGSYPDDQVIADFDGDGKLDVIVSNSNDAANDLSFFRNTSSPGAITFAAPTGMATGIISDKLTASDLDKDGRPDLVITFGSNANNQVCVLRNISTIGNIAFAALQQIDGGYPGYTSVADMDADGLPDLIVSNYTYNTISVIRNTTVGSSITFGPALVIPTLSYGVHGTAIADFDGDGKPDIAAVHLGRKFVSFLRNISTTGNILFEAMIDSSIAPSASSYGIIAEDFDGDQKPDIAFTSSALGLCVMKNKSSVGTLSFESMLKYPVFGSPIISQSADMDNDGKADLIGGWGMTGSGVKKISILRNQLGESVAVCPNGGGPLHSNILGTTYQWQIDNGSGFSNLVNGTNYNNVTSNQLQLISMPLSLVGVKYRCLVDGIPTSSWILKFGNNWLGTIDNNWETPGNWSCGSVPDINTDVVVPSGTVQVNASTTIHSITVNPGATVTVATGVVFTVLH